MSLPFIYLFLFCIGLYGMKILYCAIFKTFTFPLKITTYIYLHKTKLSVYRGEGHRSQIIIL